MSFFLNTRARIHRTRSYTVGESAREGETVEKTHFFTPVRSLVSAPLPYVKYLGRHTGGGYLVGLLLSPMPDQGESGRSWDEQRSGYFKLFRERTDAPLGFQLSWKLRLGNKHVTQRGQSEAELLPEADIPRHESMLRSRTPCKFLFSMKDAKNRHYFIKNRAFHQYISPAPFHATDLN